MRAWRVHWFSPVPPARSGISEVAECVAPALAQRSELTLWTAQDAWSADLERAFRVRKLGPDLAVPSGDDDVCVYHLGNNAEFHVQFWRAALEKPGIVVLHDTCLYALFDRHLDDSPEVQRAVARAPGGREAVEQAIAVLRKGSAPVAAQLPLLRLAADGALGVVVHTEMGRQLLERLGVSAVQADLPYRRVEAAKGAERERRRPGDPVRLVAFGHFGPNRRLASILQALSCMPERESFRFHIYGSVGRERLLALIRATGLEHVVSIHGYASDQELDAALANADLAINLRYPSMGECSISQLRVWSHATPSIVTREAWYAELGDDVVDYVRPDHEIEDIQRLLRALKEEPAPFVEKGRRGLHRLNTVHTPERYAERILDLIESVRGTGAAARAV